MGNYSFNNFGNNSDAGNKNLLTAMFASMMFLICWSIFTSPSKEELEKQKAKLQKTEQSQLLQSNQQRNSQQQDKKKINDNISGIVGDFSKKNITNAQDRKQKNEVFFENENSRIGIDVNNNRISFLSLKKYKQHEKSAKDVILLDDEHFIESGWLGYIENNNNVINSNNIKWEIDTKDSNSISLVGTASNIKYRTTYIINDDYSIEIKQQIDNKSDKKINIINYNRASLKNTKDRIENSNAFRGIIVMNDDKINEIQYDKLEKQDIENVTKNNDGWIGFSDQYWLTALVSTNNKKAINDKNIDKNTTYTARYNNNKDTYQIDIKNDIYEINPSEMSEKTIIALVAPKKLELMQNFEKKYNIPKIDKAIDFGMFYFLSKPLLIILKRLYSIVGNFGVAIILLTILVRMIILPLANRAYKTMARMKKIAPQINELKEQYKDDKKAFQMAMYQLYKDNNINPMSSILPLLLQIPVFIALYKVFIISIEMRDAPFVGWIIDLSSKDPSSIFNLFGLLPFNVPSIFQIGLLPVIMGITMFVQQKLTPMQGLDKSQQKVMNFFPLILTIMFASVPAGLILYWCCSNIFTIIQQTVLLKVLNRDSAERSNNDAK